MAKVTSNEFAREFGRYRVLAHREPVIVTNHGRDDVVLIAAEDYARLSRYEQKAFHVSQLPREVVDELLVTARDDTALNEQVRPQRRTMKEKGAG